MRLTIKGDQTVRASLQAIGRQAPYALAVALNGTANAVQREIRDSLDGRFQLRRREFIEKTIYRGRATDFATKTRPVATVRVHPERDVLAQHEAGGAKTPINGRSIAIPTANVRRNKADIVTTANRPRALLAKPNVFRQGDVILKATGRGKRRKLQALYLLHRMVRLRPRLGMIATAEQVVPLVWEREATAAITRAIQTAR